MKKYNEIIMRYKNLIIALMILILVIFLIIIGKTFSTDENVIYTREKLQKMIVSAAASYYYNNGYSDYEQNTLDYNLIYKEGTSTKYPIYSTTRFRNLKITPEEVSRSNEYNIDCSGFTFLVYNNVLGYDLSEYNKLSSSKYTTLGNNNQLILNNVNNTTFDIVKENYGRTWDTTTNLARIENCIIRRIKDKNYDKTKNNYLSCKFTDISASDITNYDDNGEFGKEAITQEYKDNDNTSIVVYKKFFENDDPNKADTLNAYKSEYMTVLNNYFMKYDTDGNLNKNFLLEPGDMIRISYSNSNGHVMIYVGDVFRKYANGMIHSTGSDDDYDSFSVRYEDSVYYYFKNKLQTILDGNNEKRITSISIVRPINAYCDTNDAGTEICTNNSITTNDKARVDFIDTQVEQYVEKDNRSISSYNSVNVGDSINYRLRLVDKDEFGFCSTNSYYATEEKCPLDSNNVSGWKISKNFEKDSKFIVEFTAPKGTTISKVFYKKTNTTTNTIEDVIISSAECNSNNTTCTVTGYRYPIFEVKVNNNTSGELDSGIFKVTKSEIESDIIGSGNPTLTLNSIKIKVNDTINNNDINKLNVTINEFKDKKITYVTGDKIDSEVDVNNVSKMNSLDYIKYIYYNNFNIDLRNLTGAGILESLFYKCSVDKTNWSSCNVGANDLEAYFKNSGTDNISKMLVTGMYGGKKLIGNDNADRIKFISTKNFEVGDIIVVAYGNVSETNEEKSSTARTDRQLNYGLVKITSKNLRYYIVTGFSGTYTILSEFNSGGITSCGDEEATFSNEINGITNYRLNDGKSHICSFRITKHLLYSSNLFAVLRPTQVYNDVSYKVTVHYGDNKTEEVDKKYNDKYEGTITIDGYSIEYYFDSDYTKKATTVNVHSNHEIYAKLIPNTYEIKFDANGGSDVPDTQYKEHDVDLILSDKVPKKVNYIFGGWATSKSDINPTYHPGDIYDKNEGIILYAIWIVEPKLVFDETLVVKNNFISNISPGTTVSELLSKIDTNGDVEVVDRNRKKVSNESIIGTGYYLNVVFGKSSASANSYLLAINGDVSGDGNVSFIDITLSYKGYVNNNLSDVNKVAIDFDKNNVFNYDDILKHVEYYKKLK